MTKRNFINTSFIIISSFTMITAQKFDIEGHRGSRGLMPENTIPAFLKALDLGVTTLELDVCISKDNQVVVSHEPYMNYLFSTKPDGSPVLKSEEKDFNIYKMTYNEIKKFDTGKRGNINFPEQVKIEVFKPLLCDMLIACEKYIKEKGLKPVNYNIEIKSEEIEYGISQPKTVDEFSNLVYKEILKQISPERVILQSFDFNVLKFWKKQIDTGIYKKVTLSALVTMEGVRPSFEKLGFLPDIFSPYYKQLTIEKIKMCHEKGVKVVPWTVNDVENMKKMKELGTDGLITDYPNLAVNLF